MASTETRPNQREHILDVALGLMSANGAAGMSMRRLAAACGVQVAAIYHYFDSKDALLAAVVAERQYGTRLGDPLPIDPAAPPEQRLADLFMFVWHGALAEEEIWRLILGEGIRGEQAVVQVGRELVALVEDATRGWVSGIVPEVESPDAVASLFMGQLLSGFVRRVFVDPAEAEGDDEIARRSADALVRAVFD